VKYVDEFRDPTTAQALLRQIEQVAAGLCQARSAPIKLMEVCGGHTHAIFKYGLEHLLPPTIELIHGPGCPICVMPRGRLDDAIWLAQQPEVIFATFGDALRVPGAAGSLLEAKAQGADVRMVYSPLDALQLTRQHPDRSVVFFGLGFETTAPSTALTLLQAEAEAISNFSVFCNHVVIVPALKALLDNPDLQLDGFVGPGHVSMVIGAHAYEGIVQQYGKPVVVSGFEPLDILQSIWMVLQQLAEGRCQVENQYTRLVQPNGNPRALQAMEQVFELRPNFEWRGLGDIALGGLQLRPRFATFDAERQFNLPQAQTQDAKACQCGEILKGVLKPWQCRVFGTACTPEHPIGACMVSSEGACAAYYKYGRYQFQDHRTESPSVPSSPSPVAPLQPVAP
jgi:hydrogenase expression/formation protein HypD